MPQNQTLTQKKDIESFKKEFRNKHGVTLYIFTPTDARYRIPLDSYLEVCLACIHEHHPELRYIKKVKGTRLRKRDYVKWIQVMCYIAWKDGHSKTEIGRAIGKNHATIINSCRMVDNGFFAKDKLVIETFDRLINKLLEHVGTIPENLEDECKSKSSIDPIWDEARRFIAKGATSR